MKIVQLRQFQSVEIKFQMLEKLVMMVIVYHETDVILHVKQKLHIYAVTEKQNELKNVMMEIILTEIDVMQNVILKNDEVVQNYKLVKNYEAVIHLLVLVTQFVEILYYYEMKLVMMVIPYHEIDVIIFVKKNLSDVMPKKQIPVYQIIVIICDEVIMIYVMKNAITIVIM